MSFDPRRPDTTHLPRNPIPYPAALVPIRLAPDVLAKIGEGFATALSALHTSLAALGPLPPASQAALDAVLAETSRLELMGIQIQELARVFAGDAPMVAERIDLARAARVALAEWSGAARAQGVKLCGPQGPLELEVNAPVLAQLLDLGLEYALRIGSQVDIDVRLEGEPTHPMLTIRVQVPTPPAARDGDVNEIHWLLFVQLAQATGLTAQRRVLGATVTLMLGFPSAEPALAHKDGRVPAARTLSLAGRHVLLLEVHEFARVQAYRLMHDAGMQVDSAATVEQARAALGAGTPDLLVTGLSVEHPQCGALISELRTMQPRLRVIELVDDDSAFAFSVPQSNRPARVGRHDMDRTLVQAMAQELDAAWAA